MPGVRSGRGIEHDLAGRRGRPAGSARAACAARGRWYRPTAAPSPRACRRAGRRAGSARRRRPLARAQPVDQRIAHQPAGRPSIGGNLDRSEALRHRAAAAARIHRLQRPQPPQQQGKHFAAGGDKQGKPALMPRGSPAGRAPRSPSSLPPRPAHAAPCRWRGQALRAPRAAGPWHGERIAQLALDLDRDGHLVLDQQRRIDRGQAASATRPRPARSRPRPLRRGAASSARRAAAASDRLRCGWPMARPSRSPRSARRSAPPPC
jgi:hypothetical protein